MVIDGDVSTIPLLMHGRLYERPGSTTDATLSETAIVDDMGLDARSEEI